MVTKLRSLNERIFEKLYFIHLLVSKKPISDVSEHNATSRTKITVLQENIFHHIISVNDII